VLFLGDGFTASQQNEFFDKTVKALLHINSFYPFNLFIDNIDVHRMFYISNQPGVSDDPANGNRRVNNHFGSRFEPRPGGGHYLHLDNRNRVRMAIAI